MACVHRLERPASVVGLVICLCFLAYGILSDDLSGEHRLVVIITAIVFVLVIGVVVGIDIQHAIGSNNPKWSATFSPVGNPQLTISVACCSRIPEERGKEFFSMQASPRYKTLRFSLLRMKPDMWPQMPDRHTHHAHVSTLEHFLRIMQARPQLLERKVYGDRLMGRKSDSRYLVDRKDDFADVASPTSDKRHVTLTNLDTNGVIPSNWA